MKKIFVSVTLAFLLIVSCTGNEQAKLENQSKAFDATLQYILAAHKNWPQLLDKDERYCLRVKNEACNGIITNTLDTIKQRRQDYLHFGKNIRNLQNHWLSFQTSSGSSGKTYKEFLALCKELDEVETVIDYWGTSVALMMDEVNKQCLSLNP